MKNILQCSLIFLLLLTNCQQQIKENKKSAQENSYDSFGEKITSNKAITSEELVSKFNSIQLGDTLNVKFISKVKEVCMVKGCWMKLDLIEELESMVRFKDYGFVVPTNSKGREVIINGKAFLKETGVKELQHYAKDAGKSEDEIAKITTPKIAISIEASGVLMKKNKG